MFFLFFLLSVNQLNRVLYYSSDKGQSCPLNLPEETLNMKHKYHFFWVATVRFILQSICGFDIELILHMPHGVDHYTNYLQEEWLHTTKATCLGVVWLILALITLIALLFGHYVNGAVIFYGLIRFTAYIMNVANVDYLNSLNKF